MKPATSSRSCFALSPTTPDLTSVLSFFLLSMPFRLPDMNRSGCLVALLGAMIGCGGHSAAPAPAPESAPTAQARKPAKPNIDSVPLNRSSASLKPDSSAAPTPAPPPERPRVAPPEAAYTRGWMGLAATGGDGLLKAPPPAEGGRAGIGVLHSTD